jgi:hypothetical protein
MPSPHPQSHRSQRDYTKLSTVLNKKLIPYVAAASAAGVGIVAAAARPADAEIVYTPTNSAIAPNTTVPLDLNNDGIVDFRFYNLYSIVRNTSCLPGCAILAELKVGRAQPGNAAWATSSNMIHRHHEVSSEEKEDSPKKKLAVAFAAPANVLVGESRRFSVAPLPLDFYRTFEALTQTQGFINSVGPWGKPGAGQYLGLKFTINGEVHYGWARLTVTAIGQFISATLTGYAYETVADAPIVTGMTSDIAEETTIRPMKPELEPASLGRLAQGATGIRAWRAAAALR